MYNTVYRYVENIAMVRTIKHSLKTRPGPGSTLMHKTIGTPPCTLRQTWVSVYSIVHNVVYSIVYCIVYNTEFSTGQSLVLGTVYRRKGGAQVNPME